MVRFVTIDLAFMLEDIARCLHRSAAQPMADEDALELLDAIGFVANARPYRDQSGVRVTLEANQQLKELHAELDGASGAPAATNEQWSPPCDEED